MNTAPASSTSPAPSGSSARTRSRFGRARFGGGSALLLSVSALIGLLVSCGLGVLLAAFGGIQRPWIGFVVGAVATLPTSIALAWAVLVDRSTLRGAIDRPQESIESVWYDRAAIGAFHDLLPILGIGAAAFSITRVSIHTGILLTALCLVVMIDFALRYRFASREGR